MGAFFGSLHVREGGVAGQAGVRQALDQACAAAGLRPAADGEEEDADRTVVLRAGDGWVSVYDQESDGDPEALGRQAQSLSATLKATVITAAVHDSDVLWLGRWDAGKPTAAYDSNPGYFDDGKRRKKKSAGAVPGGPGPWEDLLVAGGTRADLDEVFGPDRVFAEAALEPLGRALGLPLDRLQTGFRYLIEEEELLAGATVLRYVPVAAPVDRTPTGPPLLRTGLEQHVGVGIVVAPLEAALGAETRTSLTSRNVGGPGRGLRVEVSADPAVTSGEGPVAWRTVQLVLGDPRKLQPKAGARGGAAAGFLTAELVGGQVDFPDVTLPASAAFDPARPITSVAGVHRMMDQQFASQVHINLIGQAVALGEGRWQLRLVPLENPEGFARGGVVVSVRGTEGRPLRAPATVHPAMLAGLEKRDQLVLLVVAAGPVGPAVDRLATVVSALARHFSGQGKLMATLFPAGGVPKISSLKAAGFLEGKRWKDLAQAAREGALVQVSWGEAETGPGAPTAQLSLGRGIIPGPAACTALALGLSAARPDLAEVQGQLRAALDAIFAAGAGIQAFQTRWGSVPAVDSTPYELACGVHGQCTLEEGWVTRWLRGLGPGTLWLGQALAERVDRGALGAVAAVRPLGDGLAIEVGDVAAVERALAELLPGPEDWQRGMRLRYGGPT